jgi:transposase-like protein
MRSPGRPPVNRREIQQRFWRKISEGLSSEDAAIACSVSTPVGTRWFREAGGMSPITLVPPSGRYLSFAEREEIALLRAQRCGVREVARRLGRSPSTISRELRRNAATRGGGLEYRASTAQWHAERRARRPKTAKLTVNDTLRQYVQDRLAGTVTAPDGSDLRGPAVWLELVLAAQDLVCWTQALLDGHLALAEPKTLRYRLLHVAARIVRRCILRLQATWPWAVELARAFAGVRALPLRC